LDSIKKSGFYNAWRGFRQWVGDKKLYFLGVIAFIALLFMAFVVEISWRTATNTVMAALIAVSAVQLLSLRAPQD
jgi:hypothetical protein